MNFKKAQKLFHTLCRINIQKYVTADKYILYDKFKLKIPRNSKLYIKVNHLKCSVQFRHNLLQLKEQIGSFKTNFQCIKIEHRIELNTIDLTQLTTNYGYFELL